MPWNICRDFHIDINASYGRFLLVSATDSSLRQPPPDMVAGDGMPVRFHFWERGAAGALIAADPGPDTVFIFSGRPAGAPSGSDLLFLTNDFTELEAGVWEGTLDLTPAAFATHLTDAVNGSKIILGELEVRDSISNTKRNSFQFDLAARRQVYNGETPPVGITVPNWLSSIVKRLTVPPSQAVAAQGAINLEPGYTFATLPVSTSFTIGGFVFTKGAAYDAVNRIFTSHLDFYTLINDAALPVRGYSYSNMTMNFMARDPGADGNSITIATSAPSFSTITAMHGGVTGTPGDFLGQLAIVGESLTSSGHICAHTNGVWYQIWFAD